MSFIEFGKMGEGVAASISEEWDKCRKYIRGDMPLLNIFKLHCKIMNVNFGVLNTVCCIAPSS
jgi:hypothetical protein